MVKAENSPDEGDLPSTLQYTQRYSTRGVQPMKSSNTVRELILPIITVKFKCWEQFLFTFHVFPTTVTVQGFALMTRGHLGITIQTVETRSLWLHWGEDQRYRRRDVLRAGGKRCRGVLKARGTPEHLLLGGLDFTFSNLKVFPYPLRQWREV